MILVKIEDSERPLSEVSQSWLRQQIEARRESGESVCVIVTIKAGDIDMILATPGCPRSGGGGRPFRREESRIHELWEKRGLNSSDFNIGQLNAFLKEIKNI